MSSIVQSIRKLTAAALCLLILVIQLHPSQLRAEQIRIAVASNFAVPMRTIAEQFEAQYGHRVTISTGSSGKHYAQIVRGAPFDLFFSADAARPKRLEQNGHTIEDTRSTYALGRLVLWSPGTETVTRDNLLSASGQLKHLAIANPKFAPYGIAARQSLQSLNVWQTLQPKLVYGENIGQTYAFVASSNAEMGLVALSQISQQGKTTTGNYWLLPDDLHQPIEQQVVLLKESQAGRALLELVLSEQGQSIIHSFGYDIPSASQ